MSDLPADRARRILDAVDTIEQSLGVLAQKRKAVDREQYRSDRDTRDIVERRFVKVTEAAIDIGTVLVVHERGEPPESNPATMRALAEEGIVPPEVAEEMAETARFRNVLAHTYGDAIDDDVVYDALNDLERYRSFLVEVRKYLNSIDALDE
ncbi:type VII toxin-antitoxin system HepT family RNase toxin [Halosimplex marinum]|uniref:type VII toxin-antitoxin system HepT family RNase toxin n=1 Tax=Halosimplex marinum TaxID=3396620 RepID=UPI003F56F2CC